MSLESPSSRRAEATVALQATRSARGCRLTCVFAAVVSSGILSVVPALGQNIPNSSSAPALVAAPAKSASSNVRALDEDDAPAVAQRLWHDLFCSCPEKDCSNEPLAACHCHFAAAERRKILAQVRRLGFGSPK